MASVAGVPSQEQAAAPTIVSRLRGARSAGPEPHSSPQRSPCTPNTPAQAPARGATPQNPATSPGHATLGVDSALKLAVQRGPKGPRPPGPSTPQPSSQGPSRIPGGHVSTSGQHCPPRASCLLSLASPNTARPGERAGERDGNSHLSREPRTPFHPSASTWKISCRGGKPLKRAPFLRWSCSAPFTLLTSGQTGKTLLPGVAPHAETPLKTEAQ